MKVEALHRKEKNHVWSGDFHIELNDDERAFVAEAISYMKRPGYCFPTTSALLFGILTGLDKGAVK